MSNWQNQADDFWDEEGGGGGGGGGNNEASSGNANSSSTGGNATKKKPPAGATSGSGQCPNCGSRAIESLGASGANVCTDCGVVVEENAIVSSVEFAEGAGGGSSMVGKFVGASGRAPRGGGRPGSGADGYGYSRACREITLLAGRRRLQHVASQMRLPTRFVDAAHRLYVVALDKNFTCGRKRSQVVAAVMYCACRQERTHHMLIDFSDVLQVNVYKLGGTFLQFRRLLGLKLEIIDPALFIYRFAAHLKLDDKANAVSMTALRIVGRMKRDWIVAGRRPAGICAAALLIASRAHGFSRGHKDVTDILQICGVTVQQRLREFQRTSSAKMTLEEFGGEDNEPEGPEADPPVFTKNRLREARARAVARGDVALLTSGALDNPTTESAARAARWRKPREMTEKEREEAEVYEEIEAEMIAEADGDTGLVGKVDKKKKDDAGEEGAAAAKKTGEGREGDDEVEVVEEGTEGRVITIVDKGDPGDVKREKLKDLPHFHRPSGISTLHADIAYPRGANRRPLVLPNEATAEELAPYADITIDILNFAEWKVDLPRGSAEDVDDLFRTDDEVREREAVFNAQNKDYIETQAKKESDRLMSEAAMRAREDDEMAQEEGRNRYLKKSSRSRKRRSGEGSGGEDRDELTTEEALLEVVRTRKTSRKINYDAMSALFDDSGNFATDLLDDDENNRDEGMVEEV